MVANFPARIFKLLNAGSQTVFQIMLEIYEYLSIEYIQKSILIYIYIESPSASIDYDMVLFQCFVFSRHRVAMAFSTAL